MLDFPKVCLGFVRVRVKEGPVVVVPQYVVPPLVFLLGLPQLMVLGFAVLLELGEGRYVVVLDELVTAKIAVKGHGPATFGHSKVTNNYLDDKQDSKIELGKKVTRAIFVRSLLRPVLFPEEVRKKFRAPKFFNNFGP